MIRARFNPASIKERKRTYDTWTKTGIECEENASLCDTCPIWERYGIRTGDGCYQKEANDILKSKGVKMPGQGFKYIRYGLEQDARD